MSNIPSKTSKRMKRKYLIVFALGITLCIAGLMAYQTYFTYIGAGGEVEYGGSVVDTQPFKIRFYDSVNNAPIGLSLSVTDESLTPQETITVGTSDGMATSTLSYQSGTILWLYSYSNTSYPFWSGKFVVPFKPNTGDITYWNGLYSISGSLITSVNLLRMDANPHYMLTYQGSNNTAITDATKYDFSSNSYKWIGELTVVVETDKRQIGNSWFVPLTSALSPNFGTFLILQSNVSMDTSGYQFSITGMQLNQVDKKSWYVQLSNPVVRYNLKGYNGVYHVPITITAPQNDFKVKFTMYIVSDMSAEQISGVGSNGIAPIISGTNYGITPQLQLTGTSAALFIAQD